jgi:hypothetical protein
MDEHGQGVGYPGVGVIEVEDPFCVQGEEGELYPAQAKRFLVDLNLYLVLVAA